MHNIVYVDSGKSLYVIVNEEDYPLMRHLKEGDVLVSFRTKELAELKQKHLDRQTKIIEAGYETIKKNARLLEANLVIVENEKEYIYIYVHNKSISLN